MVLHILAFCAVFNLGGGLCIAMWHLHSKGWFILESLHNTPCYVEYAYRCQVCISMHIYAFMRALLLMERQIKVEFQASHGFLSCVIFPVFPPR